MPQKVLFIDTAHPTLQDQLEGLGFVCEYHETYGYDQYLTIIDQYVGLIVRSKIPVDRQLLDAASELRFIARVGAGMENIAVDYAHQRGIACFNAPEGNRDAVAEHAVAMLLSLFRNLIKADGEVRSGIWKREENRGIEIKGKTVAIIGYGNTGSAFARKLSGFECRIMAYDKYKSGFASKLVEEVTMPQIFEEADILSLHLPLSEETRYLVDTKYINNFQKSFYLINTSRGAVVHTTDLLTALEVSKISGACLDVLEYEKFSFEAIQPHELSSVFQRLVKRADVVLSPHIAGWTHESNRRMADVLVQKISRL